MRPDCQTLERTRGSSRQALHLAGIGVEPPVLPKGLGLVCELKTEKEFLTFVLFFGEE